MKLNPSVTTDKMSEPKGKGARNLRVVEPEADSTPETQLGCSTGTENSVVHQETGASLPMNEAASSSGEDNNADICGICIESIYEKGLPKQKTFGILPNCNHAFCELCLVTWRQMDGYSAAVVKGCPVCRVRSDFYLPSDSIVEGEEKEQLIKSTKQRCREDFCRFFNENGCCPFEEECGYTAARTRTIREEDKKDPRRRHYFVLIS
ncbi:E3 ubiquitin-protein ligase makorin-1-like isoform X1 [Takifugu rubripes]|uniref:E3 ubiquitin-protein ligase makorin-1-like isoform X1 n=1 Tax=Takifugu rubripes TaxID=31033 RepID=UPI001145A6AC|nr:E3 ubiquitin-protein ligase makorin-1-like isoform X1 [Takifugu rubripes]